jgi:signal peptidase I
VRRGDIIVFRSPINPAETLVKRAIGIPGDRIRIENKQLILNGRRVDEPYKMHITGYLLPYRDTFPDRPAGDIYPGAVDMLRNHVANGEVIVPAGSYFAMGDNRDNSLDSRYWGFIPRENIIGKPVLVFWSFDAPTEHLADGNIRLDHVADVALHFFSKTRWDRTFRLVRGYPLQ